jgi:hypothetical protein
MDTADSHILNGGPPPKLIDPHTKQDFSILKGTGS